MAVVTAASAGIGAACARELHARGYHVSLLARSNQVLDIARELDGVATLGSVADPEAPARLVASTLEFTSAVRLPTFDVQAVRLLKRLTLIIRDGTVEHVFYPVFPPDANAQQVVDWLVTHRSD